MISHNPYLKRWHFVYIRIINRSLKGAFKHVREIQKGTKKRRRNHEDGLNRWSENGVEALRTEKGLLSTQIECQLLDHVNGFYIPKYPYSPKVQERRKREGKGRGRKRKKGKEIYCSRERRQIRQNVNNWWMYSLRFPRVWNFSKYKVEEKSGKKLGFTWVTLPSDTSSTGYLPSTKHPVRSVLILK